MESTITTLLSVLTWCLVGYLIIKAYEKLGMLIIEKDAEKEYKQKTYILLSFLGPMNFIIVPYLKIK